MSQFVVEINRFGPEMLCFRAELKMKQLRAYLATLPLRPTKAGI